MSDRLAVFNRGQIEQVGTPAEVYERPATGFVAGFVGVSNVLDGSSARQIAGDDHAFTIRPEKIALKEPGATVGPDEGKAVSVVSTSMATTRRRRSTRRPSHPVARDVQRRAVVVSATRAGPLCGSDSSSRSERLGGSPVTLGVSTWNISATASPRRCLRVAR